jgi:hypothetical protein
MGMATRLYGCIEEYGSLNEKKQIEVCSHNEKIISALPDSDAWPPLSKNMFAITHSGPTNAGPNYAYTGRIIHFGANFKSVENEWNEWKEKFEELLKNLLWLSANVHFQTEYSDLQTFKWRMNLKKWHIENDENKSFEPIKKEYWDFEGDMFWENLK